MMISKRTSHAKYAGKLTTKVSYATNATDRSIRNVWQTYSSNATPFRGFVQNAKRSSLIPTGKTHITTTNY